MDKQKQIEEMAKELREIQPLFYASIAEQLYNAGYRKISENAVVLTREAYNRLFTKARQSEIKTIDLESIVNARKETAEKYHAEMEKAIESVPNATKEFVQAWKAKNDEICKEITGEN